MPLRLISNLVDPHFVVPGSQKFRCDHWRRVSNVNQITIHFHSQHEIQYRRLVSKFSSLGSLLTETRYVGVKIEFIGNQKSFSGLLSIWNQVITHHIFLNLPMMIMSSLWSSSSFLLMLGYISLHYHLQNFWCNHHWRLSTRKNQSTSRIHYKMEMRGSWKHPLRNASTFFFLRVLLPRNCHYNIWFKIRVAPKIKPNACN